MNEVTPPLVSVIIPTYNRAGTILRSIQSVLAQDYQNLEVIVVDDGSTDQTQNILSSVADERVRLIVHEKNRGVGAARNSGIFAAAGDLVAFQDSDDEWLQGKLSSQVEKILEIGEQCVLVYCVKIVYGRDAAYRRGPRRAACVPGPEEKILSGDIRKRLWRDNLISTQTMLVRTQALREIGGFDERLFNSEEWDLAIRLSSLGIFAFVDEPLVNTYIQKDSISTLSSKAPYSQLIIINKLKRQGVTSKAWAGRLGRLGYAVGRLGYPRRGDKLMRASLARNPFLASMWVRFLVNRSRF
ncbi:glycosyltransferase family 2 protein [Aestuariivita boseongensis]|uniref:glycosyltransferase family 2 protein n=1 Tax=Aestuariivita boseongensis TaxID=1470562 RepID=UPI0006809B5C|nr:glycosyltransferase [Aestuariivita boseongensis]